MFVGVSIPHNVGRLADHGAGRQRHVRSLAQKACCLFATSTRPEADASWQACSSLRGLSPPRFSIPRFLHPRWLTSVEGCLRVRSTIQAAPRAFEPTLRAWIVAGSPRTSEPAFLAFPVPRLVHWQRAGIGPIGAVQGRHAHSNPCRALQEHTSIYRPRMPRMHGCHFGSRFGVCSFRAGWA